MDKYHDLADLAARWKGAVRLDASGTLTIKDETPLRGAAMDELVFNAVFCADATTRTAARALIGAAAVATGAKPASIQGLYEARGRGEVHGFTVPAINIRGLTYDFARAIFRVA